MAEYSALVKILYEVDNSEIKKVKDPLKGQSITINVATDSENAKKDIKKLKDELSELKNILGSAGDGFDFTNTTKQLNSAIKEINSLSSAMKNIQQNSEKPVALEVDADSIRKILDFAKTFESTFDDAILNINTRLKTLFESIGKTKLPELDSASNTGFIIAKETESKLKNLVESEQDFSKQLLAIFQGVEQRSINWDDAFNTNEFSMTVQSIQEQLDKLGVSGDKFKSGLSGLQTKYPSLIETTFTHGNDEFKINDFNALVDTFYKVRMETSGVTDDLSLAKVSADELRIAFEGIQKGLNHGGSLTKALKKDAESSIISLGDVQKHLDGIIQSVANGVPVENSFNPNDKIAVLVSELVRLKGEILAVNNIVPKEISPPNENLIEKTKSETKAFEKQKEVIDEISRTYRTFQAEIGREGLGNHMEIISADNFEDAYRRIFDFIKENKGTHLLELFEVDENHNPVQRINATAEEIKSAYDKFIADIDSKKGQITEYFGKENLDQEIQKIIDEISGGGSWTATGNEYVDELLVKLQGIESKFEDIQKKQEKFNSSLNQTTSKDNSALKYDELTQFEKELADKFVKRLKDGSDEAIKMQIALKRLSDIRFGNIEGLINHTRTVNSPTSKMLLEATDVTPTQNKREDITNALESLNPQAYKDYYDRINKERELQHQQLLEDEKRRQDDLNQLSQGYFATFDDDFPGKMALGKLKKEFENFGGSVEKGLQKINDHFADNENITPDGGIGKYVDYLRELKNQVTETQETVGSIFDFTGFQQRDNLEETSQEQIKNIENIGKAAEQVIESLDKITQETPVISSEGLREEKSEFDELNLKLKEHIDVVNLAEKSEADKLKLSQELAVVLADEAKAFEDSGNKAEEARKKKFQDDLSNITQEIESEIQATEQLTKARQKAIEIEPAKNIVSDEIDAFKKEQPIIENHEQAILDAAEAEKLKFKQSQELADALAAEAKAFEDSGNKAEEAEKKKLSGKSSDESEFSDIGSFDKNFTPIISVEEVKFNPKDTDDLRNQLQAYLDEVTADSEFKTSGLSIKFDENNEAIRAVAMFKNDVEDTVKQIYGFKSSVDEAGEDIKQLIYLGGDFKKSFEINQDAKDKNEAFLTRLKSSLEDVRLKAFDTSKSLYETASKTDMDNALASFDNKINNIIDGYVGEYSCLTYG